MIINNRAVLEFDLTSCIIFSFLHQLKKATKKKQQNPVQTKNIFVTKNFSEYK